MAKSAVRRATLVIGHVSSLASLTPIEPYHRARGRRRACRHGDPVSHRLEEVAFVTVLTLRNDSITQATESDKGEASPSQKTWLWGRYGGAAEDPQSTYCTTIESRRSDTLV